MSYLYHGDRIKFIFQYTAVTKLFDPFEMIDCKVRSDCCCYHELDLFVYSCFRTTSQHCTTIKHNNLGDTIV